MEDRPTTAAPRHVLVLGASGLVGHAAARHFAAQPGVRVTAVSRQAPPVPTGAPHLALDLLDAGAVASALAALPPVTHVAYAAVREQPRLVEGWTRSDHVDDNARMLQHMLQALRTPAHRAALRHVTILQGPKAYGAHAGPLPVPAREGVHERRDLPNFYWAQEDVLRAQQAGQAWRWTIFRPVMVVGEAVGASMNLLATLGVYAALAAEQGTELAYPGTPGLVKQPTDVDLLARAIDWAGRSPAAADETFNIDNGELCSVDGAWPAICAAFGVRPGGVRPTCLADELSGREADWDRIRAAHGLRAPDLPRFLGSSPQLADFSLGSGPAGLRSPVILSAVKLRRAGFHDVLDADTMWRQWIARYQAHGLLPRPRDTTLTGGTT
ncbi:MAG: NAD-dependent epimerase/dehydratase family protein [Rubrivivax sp.]